MEYKMVRRKTRIKDGDDLIICGEWVLAYGAIGEEVGEVWKFGEVRRPVKLKQVQIKGGNHDNKTK